MAGNDAFTKLLLHCDGTNGSTTFPDDSAGGAHGNATVAGDAAVSTAQSVFGGASFHSTTGYITYASSADWNLGAAGSGDFSIDVRMRLHANSAATGCCIVNASDNASSGWQWTIETGAARLRHSAGTQSTVTWGRSLDTWYLLSLDRSGSTMTFFVDGVAQGTFTDMSMDNQSLGLFFNSYDQAGSFPADVYLDEIRISKGVSRYSGANFTPPGAPYDSAQQPYQPWAQRGPLLAQFDKLKSGLFAPRQPRLLVPGFAV